MGKREFVVIGLVLGLVLLVSVFSAGAGAAGPLPDGVQVFEVDGHTCVSDMRGGLQCWCTGECGDPVSCGDTTFDSPLPTPVPTATDIPNKTVVPYITPTVPDVPPVTPVEPTETPDQ